MFEKIILFCSRCVFFYFVVNLMTVNNIESMNPKFLPFVLFLFFLPFWNESSGNSAPQNKMIDSLITLIKTDKLDTNKVNHLNTLSWILKDQNLDTAIILSQQALDVITPVSSLEFFSAKEGKEDRRIKAIRAKTLGNLGVYYYLKTDHFRALDYFLRALKIGEELKNKNQIATILGNTGNIYLDQGNYSMALDYYFKALKIDEGLGNKNGIIRHLSNIGNVFFFQNNFPNSLEYYFKALKISEEQGDDKQIEIGLSGIGDVYETQGDHPKALDYYFKSMKMAENLGDKDGIARNLCNIGEAYSNQGDYQKALDYHFRALKLAENLGEKDVIALAFGNIGSLYAKARKFKQAEQYLKQAIALDESIFAMNILWQNEEALSRLYDTTAQQAIRCGQWEKAAGDFKQSNIYYKKAIALKDTLFSQENKKQLVRKEMNYEFDKKETVIKAAHDKEMAVAEAEKKKQKIIIWSVIGGLLLVVVFSFFMFNRWRITQKQKEIIEKQNEKIVDSITYAQRIQQSVLMEETEIQNFLPDCFIYFQPKDIVSGDFYWCSKINDKIIIAAVDCTGHGVPGAFMSMVGNTLLNQIVNEKQITMPSEILRLLNIGVYDALHQEKEEALSRDGMDTALCCIDLKKNEVQFAGAQNPLYILSDNEVIVIKADKQGIGGEGSIFKIANPIKREFTNHIIPIRKDMSIYLFTDGYMDQFGGIDNKKFGIQRFKDLLLGSQHLDMQKQKKIIADAHKSWQGSTPQIDDILVIGVRI